MISSGERERVKWEEEKERRKKRRHKKTATKNAEQKAHFLPTDCSRGGNNNSI